MRAPAFGGRMEIISTRITPASRRDDTKRGPWARSIHLLGVSGRVRLSIMKDDRCCSRGYLFADGEGGHYSLSDHAIQKSE